MLKKSDLSKQFELVIKQEIKNYEDSLNFVLQSIKDLNDAVERVRNQSLENHASLHSAQSNLKIELENLKEEINKLNLSYSSSTRDQEKINRNNVLEMRDITSNVIAIISIEKKLESDIKAVSTDLTNVRFKTEANHRLINDSLDDLLRRFRQEIAKTKSEILERPTEASLVKTQLEEKIASHTVDVAGIMHELQVYKHDNLVTQKKLENVYTLLERLKKSEVKP